MVKHLLNSHDIDVNKKAANKLAAADASQTKLKFPGMGDALKPATRDEIIFKLTLWLANSFRPYTTVDDTDFRDLVQMLRPGFELPKKDTIRSVAKKLALLIKEHVRAMRDEVLIGSGVCR